MGWRGGETPLAILFFFRREKRDVYRVFFIDVLFFQKGPGYHPLIMERIPVEHNGTTVASISIACHTQRLVSAQYPGTVCCNQVEALTTAM